MQQQRTPAQIEAARTNGAKSKGPVTPEGKANSQRNAVKHGLQSHKLLVIEGEDPAKFNNLLNACIAEFQPASEVEFELIVEIAAARWRMRRSWSVETAMLDMEVEKQRTAIDAKYADPDAALRHASAFLGLGQNLHLLDRYETRLRRSYDRALRNFYELRARRANTGTTADQATEPDHPENAFLPNEPGHLHENKCFEVDNAPGGTV